MGWFRGGRWGEREWLTISLVLQQEPLPWLHHCTAPPLPPLPCATPREYSAAVPLPTSIVQAFSWPERGWEGEDQFEANVLTELQEKRSVVVARQQRNTSCR